MGNLFGFLSGTPEQHLVKACQANDVPAARQALLKMFPNGERDIHGKLDAIKDEEGKNPLMVAAKHGAVDCIQLLLQSGANADARHFMQSSTALHYAAGWGKMMAVIALLDAGADPTTVNAQGLTPMDLARLQKHVEVVRSLERRMSVFYGWLKWERSTILQAGIGKFLGPSVKEAMRGKFGGEWRDCWVVVTKLSGKASNIMLCPQCRGHFSDGREPGTKILCPHCRSELHIPQSSTVSILELAIYESAQSARPEITFPLSVVSVENEFHIPDVNMWAARIYVQRPPEVGVVGKGNEQSQSTFGLVDGNGKNPLWGQSVLAAKSNDRAIKKIVFGVSGNDRTARQHLARFVDALRAAPMNGHYFAAQSRAQGGMEGVTLSPNLMPTQSTMAVRRPAPPPPSSAAPPGGLTGARADDGAGVVQVSLNQDWTCAVCTLHNEGAALRCEACDTPRDASPLEVARVRNTQQRGGNITEPSPKSIVPQGVVAPAPPPRTRQAVAQATVVEPPPIEEIEVIDPDEIPAHFICPLTHQVMDDPVVTVDGMSYERNTILAHFRQNGAVNPINMAPLGSNSISPNIALRRAIQEWRASIPVASIAVI